MLGEGERVIDRARERDTDRGREADRGRR